MPKTVLFTPLGGTDPISETNLHEGAMLHIVRHYRPDKVYLYMSKEIIAHHEADNRYIYCLEKLCESIGLACEFELIQRPDLVSVADFDYFYFEFKPELLRIRDEIEKDGTILINISSGSPAMKSALIVLVSLGVLDAKTIQVVTPERKMNEHVHRNPDPVALWENNMDSLLGAENRCREVECRALGVIQQENYIKTLLRKYDYAAALEMAKEIPEVYTEDYIELLRMAERRSLMDFREVDKILAKTDVYSVPVKAGDQRRLFEYALMLDIKLKRGEYADFIRGISPLITKLFQRIVNVQLHIDVEKYLTKEDNWDRGKLNSDAVGRELLEILDKAYRGNGGFRYGHIYAVHLKEILVAKLDNEKTEIVSIVKDLRKVEEALRNQAAHTMVSVTETTIAKAGFTPEQIMKKLRTCFVHAGISIKGGQWQDYDTMNEAIIGVIESNRK